MINFQKLVKIENITLYKIFIKIKIIYICFKIELI